MKHRLTCCLCGESMGAPLPHKPPRFVCAGCVQTMTEAKLAEKDQSDSYQALLEQARKAPDLLATLTAKITSGYERWRRRSEIDSQPRAFSAGVLWGVTFAMGFTARDDVSPHNAMAMLAALKDVAARGSE